MLRTFYIFLLCLCLSACATAGETYRKSRPFTRVTQTGVVIESYNYTKVDSAITTDPETGVIKVEQEASRAKGWSSVTTWVAGIWALLKKVP